MPSPSKSNTTRRRSATARSCRSSSRWRTIRPSSTGRDPTRGTQYRSAIFTTSDEQKKVADAYIAQLNAAKVYSKPIVTKVGPLQGFFPAEDYHQDYLTLHPSQPYIAYNDIPKVENLKKLFAANYLDKPTLVSSAKVTN